MATKILIIKLGYSETLDPEIGRVPSLGDVVRTTPILWALKEKYPDSHITWLVDDKAVPLLHENKLIDRILIWDNFVPFQLMREKFDVLVNLEKIPGVAALSDIIDAWTKYGFRFDSISGTYHAYEKGLSFINYMQEKMDNKSLKDCWQKVLVEMLGIEWNEQKYIIGYKPKTEEIYDIGLNCKVGSKWPTKAMPVEKWKELGKSLLDSGFKISWQQGLKDLYEYMDWINSCKLLISQDSLGLHTAFALKKKVIGLFGPTDPHEVYFYNNSRVIYSQQECQYMPCYDQRCISDLNCMDGISINDIVDTVKSIVDEEKIKDVA